MSHLERRLPALFSQERAGVMARVFKAMQESEQ